MLAYAIRMEMTKVFRRRMTWVLVGILALLVAGVYLLIYAAAQKTLSDPAASAGTVEEVRGMLCWPEALSGLLSFTGGAGLGGLMLIVLAGAMTAQEYSWRTSHLWLSRGLPRPAFLLAKYATLCITALLVVLTALLVASPLTAWFTLQLTGTIGVADLNLAEMGLSVLRTGYTILPYAGLTFLVAILTRSTAAAVAAGMVYSLVVEVVLVQLLGLAGGIWADIARYTPASLAGALMQTNQRLIDIDLGAGLNTELAGPWVAVGGITLYVVAFLGLSLWAFRRQDLTG